MKQTMILVLLLVSCVMAEDPKPKLAEVQGDSGVYVFADGVWEPDNPTRDNALVYTAVKIQCWRTGGRELVGTEAFCLVATATPISSMLSVDATFLKVVSWDKHQIITLDSSPICLTSQNTIDLHSNTVSGLDIKKPAAKGLGDVCKLLPDRQTYYLRDKVDYMLFHQPKKK